MSLMMMMMIQTCDQKDETDSSLTRLMSFCLSVSFFLFFFLGSCRSRYLTNLSSFKEMQSMIAAFMSSFKEM